MPTSVLFVDRIDAFKSALKQQHSLFTTKSRKAYPRL